MENKSIWQALKKVIDPELGVNIVDLGLVYDVRREGEEVEVEMTLTSPGCPLAPVIDQLIRSEVKQVKGVKRVNVELVWDPPWIPEMMSEEIRAELGFD